MLIEAFTVKNYLNWIHFFFSMRDYLKFTY